MKSPSSLGSLTAACRRFAPSLGCLLFLATAWRATADGVAAVRQEYNNSDAWAQPLVFLSMKQAGEGKWKIVTASKTLTVDESWIAGVIEIPKTIIPDDVVTPEQAQPLRDLENKIHNFSGRFTSCEPALRAQEKSLKDELAKYDKGMRRMGGKWLSKKEFAALQKQSQEAAAALVRQEEEKDAELDRLLGEQRAAKAKREKESAKDEAAQRAKGLGYWDGKWLPVAEADALKEADRILEAAREEVKSRTIFKAKFTVLDIEEDQDAVLMEVVEGESKRGGEKGKVAALYGLDTTSVRKGQTYQNSVFWVGSSPFTTVSGEMRVVQNYYFYPQQAVDGVIAYMWHDGAPWTRGEKPAGSAKREPGKSTKKEGKAGGALDILAGASGCGSAFFIGSEGYLVTNAHVAEAGKTLQIYYQERVIPANVVKVNKTADLALLKIDAKVEGLPIVEAEAQPGSDVFAIGYPQPLLQGLATKVTKGIINSSKGSADDKDTIFQIDAAIQPGNSGGPLCDSAGHLVGVTVATLDPLIAAEESGSLPQNVNYAIKASEVLTLLRSKGVSFTSAKPAAEATAGATDAMQKAMKATVLVICR